MALFNILIDIAAKTASFEEGMKRVESRLDSFAKFGKQLEHLGIAELIKKTGEALAENLRAGLERAESLNKLAQQAGIAASELSKLQFAANQSGVQNDALAVGIKKLNVNISDAAGGSAEAQAAFAAMGVSVKNADGSVRGAADVLSDTAEKFSHYKDGADKTALAVQLFGRAGSELIPLLNSGAAGLKEFGIQAEKAGLAIGDETAKAAEEANDKLTLLARTITEGFGNKVIENLLPSLSKFADTLKTAKDGITGMDELAKQAAAGIRVLASAGVILGGAFEIAGKYIGSFYASIVQAAHGNFSGAAEIARAAASDIGDEFKGIQERLSALWDTSANAIEQKAPETGAKIAAPSLEAAKKSKEALDKLNADINRFTAGIGDPLAGMQEDIARANDALQRGFEGARSAALTSGQRIREEYDANIAALEKYAKAHPEAADQVQYLLEQLADRYKENTAVVSTETDKMSAYAEEAARNMQDAFANFLFDPFKGGLKGMLTGFIDTIRRMVANAAAADVFESLFGKSKDGSGSNLGGLLQGIIGAFGGGKASGGPLDSGKWYVAGEKGPEPIWGGGAGAFAMGYPGGGSSGGGDITINMPIDARGATQDAVKLLPVVARQASDDAVARILAMKQAGRF